MKLQQVPANYNDSVPTLLAWSKEVADWSTAIRHRVEVVWLPNLYNNYTLQTSAYKFRVPKGHPYFEAIEGEVQSWQDTGAVLFLEVQKNPSLTVSLFTVDEEHCDWSQLGEAGFKCGAVSRRKSTSPKKTRTVESRDSSLVPS